MINFQIQPDQYQHWKVSYQGAVATIGMDVNADGGLVPGYELKLNSYDLGVDIELYDILQRIRFEHPEVRSVIITSLKEKVFCSGANIRMLAQSSHGHKVNFCKFTNETRNSIEDASQHSGLTFFCAVNGTAAGGGYELALATDRIIMVDDGSAAVSLPEVPLLAVLPGTGGLTRLVDKRQVRRDHSDYFCTREEGIAGRRAVDWRLVDEVIPSSKFADAVHQQALEAAEKSDRPRDAEGILLSPLNRQIEADQIRYSTMEIELDRANAAAVITIQGPKSPAPKTAESIEKQGTGFWPFAFCRELDDLILHLRANETEIGSFVFKSAGDSELLVDYDDLMLSHQDNWFVKEITLYLKRTFKRLDVSSRSIIALIEPGSCFAGTLLEIVLNADRSFMLDGEYEGIDMPPPTVRLTGMNFGPMQMVNGLTRLQSRFLDDPEEIHKLENMTGKALLAREAEELRLVTFIPDDIDWDDEIRLALEERAGFSPDALTGMEANLRFGGPETMESKIFARLTAWQNWIFQRPNAVGEEGALQRFGTGKRGNYNKQRV
ncbi:MAG: 2,3-epoxybenzoyl-CoA dihydrolase [SAR324 cluster bacterium]|nr:2,3-epoxybenzoyl-CoA dihydrolase [SAR324 cluster bacterium]